MKALAKRILQRLPFVSRQEGHFEAGGYYSPVPNKLDIVEYLKKKDGSFSESSFPDINLRKRDQFALLQQYASYYEDLPFPEEKSAQHRYYFNNEWFAYADAIFLYCFLRHFKPGKIIEVGSGYSSAVVLDTLEHHPYGHVDFTLIEPFPERLYGALKAGDKKGINVIDQKLQDVELDVFSTLKAGDLLFIDSSHVVKCGSDVQKLFFEIIPYLPVGVFVHFHDIFCGFEYPSEWLNTGFYWNEDYFLRAFLSYNDSWSILFFNSYIGCVFRNELEEKMPLCLKNPGGSIYLQRIK